MVSPSPGITDNEGGNFWERHDVTTEKRNPQPKENEIPVSWDPFECHIPSVVGCICKMT